MYNSIILESSHVVGLKIKSASKIKDKNILSEVMDIPFYHVTVNKLFELLLLV